MCVLLPDPADSLAAAPQGALSEGGRRNERVAAWGRAGLCQPCPSRSHLPSPWTAPLGHVCGLRSGRHTSTLLPVGAAVSQRPLRRLSLPPGPETLTLSNLASSRLAPPGPVSQQEGLSLTPPDGVEMLPWVGSGHSPAACLENLSRSFPSASTLGQSKPALPRASPWWA